MSISNKNFMYAKRYKYARVVLPSGKMVIRKLEFDKKHREVYFYHQKNRRVLYVTGSGSWVATGGYRVFSFTNSPT